MPQVNTVVTRLKPAEITPIRSRFRYCVHAYHGVDPWNRVGTCFIYLGFDTQNEGFIILRHMDSGNETILAETKEVNYHSAAHQCWALEDHAVLFNTKANSGAVVPALVHVAQPGQIERFEHLPGRVIRHIAGCGKYVYMYASPQSGAREAAIERMALDTQNVEVLVNQEEALDALPLKWRDPEAAGWFFNHPVPNAAGTRVFFKLMKIRSKGGSAFHAFGVRELPQGPINYFGARVSGHPFWMDDDQYILNIMHPWDGSDNRWLVLVDSTNGRTRRLIDSVIEGPGHPSQSPDKQWIVTDAFTANGQQAPIYAIDVATGVVREIARLKHQFIGGVEAENNRVTRAQPHPVWSPDSKQLLVNCNHGEDRLELQLLSKFTTDHPTDGEMWWS